MGAGPPGVGTLPPGPTGVGTPGPGVLGGAPGPGCGCPGCGRFGAGGGIGGAWPPPWAEGAAKAPARAAHPRTSAVKRTRVAPGGSIVVIVSEVGVVGLGITLRDARRGRRAVFGRAERLEGFLQSASGRETATADHPLPFERSPEILGGVHPGLERTPMTTVTATTISIVHLAVLSGTAATQDLFPGRLYDLGGNAIDLAVADLDGDGRADAVAALESQKIRVARAQGGGELGAGVDFPVGGTPRALVLADVDLDGKLDAVLARGSGLAVLLGDGTGGFAAPIASVALGDSTGLALGDVNGDGKPDAVAVNVNGSTLWVSPGAGNGTFPTVQTMALPSSVLSQRREAVALGNFDADVHLDYFVASAAGVLVIRGDGAGGGSAPTTFSLGLGVSAYGVATGDFDGDGKLDVAAVGPYWSGKLGILALLRGDGLGGVSGQTLHGVQGLHSSSPLGSLVVGNFVKSQALDVAVATSQGVALYPGIGNGALEAPQAIWTGNGCRAIDAGDFDGDGARDLATVNREFPSSNFRDLVLHRSSLAGAIPSATFVPWAFSHDAAELIDFDGDGDLDVSISSISGIGYLGNGHGIVRLKNGIQVESSSVIPIVGSEAGVQYWGAGTTAADLNFDGCADVLGLGTFGIPFTGGLQIQLTGLIPLMQGPTGAFVKGLPSLVAPAGMQADNLNVIDVNGDGWRDAVWRTWGAVALSIRGPGDSFLPVELAWPTSEFVPGPLHFADLDQNGTIDLVLPGNGSQVLLNDGNGGFASAGAYPVGSQYVFAADLNLDGALDLVGDTGLVFFGNGTGQFPTIALGPRFYTPPTDIDGNGYLDALDTTSGKLAFTPATGILSYGASKEFAGGANAQQLLVGDLHSDGRPDVVAVPFVNSNEEGFILLPNTLASPQGLSAYGTGTPGCQGHFGLAANSVPKVGSAGFALLGSNALPNTAGLVLVGDAQDAPGSNPFGLGFLLHVDLLASTELIPLTIASDAGGAAYAAAPIPNLPALAGKSYFAQTLWEVPPAAACGAPFGVVTSRGLAITIQP